MKHHYTLCVYNTEKPDYEINGYDCSTINNPDFIKPDYELKMFDTWEHVHDVYKKLCTTNNVVAKFENKLFCVCYNRNN